MKSIDTLVEDIYGVLGKDSFDTETLAKNLANRIGNKVQEARSRADLRMSNLGLPDRKLWYTINRPELAEALPPEAKMKFLFGDILEELLLQLSREAGHTVEGEQDELDLYGVKGHRDAIIDGWTVDVKSASSRSFDKFNSHLSAADDSFGYIAQLDSYIESGRQDGRITEKDRGAFLVIDKTLGHVCLDKHNSLKVNYKSEIEAKRKMLASDKPPPKCFAPEPMGKSGNMKLGTVCSYCPFKKHCWTGMRTFIYSSGPVYLTRVERLPEVPEV